MFNKKPHPVKTVLLLMLCISFSAKAQELKMVKKTLTSNPFTEEKEEYQVLKSDKKIRHGSYVRLVNEKVVETGFYKNNQKDSLWTKFYSQTGAIREQGNYLNGQRAGTWSFYNFKKEKEQVYDFTDRRVVEMTADSTAKIGWVIMGTDTVKTNLDFVATLIGGNMAFGEIMGKNIRYPVAAIRKGISGQVLVSLVVDEAGKASAHKVIKPLNKDCDAEALRVSLLLTDWLPAIKDGKPVKSICIVPISFNFGGIVR